MKSRPSFIKSRGDVSVLLERRWASWIPRCLTSAVTAAFVRLRWSLDPRASTIVVRENNMRALCWHGKGDVRVDTIPDRTIQHPGRDSRDRFLRHFWFEPMRAFNKSSANWTYTHSSSAADG